MDNGDWRAIVHGVTRGGHNLVMKEQTTIVLHLATLLRIVIFSIHNHVTGSLISGFAN